MYELTKNSQKGMRSMKKKISRMLVCFLMVFTLVAGTAVEASAAISFQGIYALSNGKVRFKISKATKGEAKVKYTFQNIFLFCFMLSPIYHFTRILVGIPLGPYNEV